MRPQGSPEEVRQHARQVLAMAEDPQPGDEVSVRELLLAAATSRRAAGDVDEAVDLLRRASQEPDGAWLDVRGDLHRLLLSEGREEDARALAHELRRQRPTPAFALGDVAGNLWAQGHLEEAHRWYTLAASRLLGELESGAPSPEQRALTTVLAARAELRAEMDLPADELDELGGELDAEDLDALDDDLE